MNHLTYETELLFEAVSAWVGVKNGAVIVDASILHDDTNGTSVKVYLSNVANVFIVRTSGSNDGAFSKGRFTTSSIVILNNE